jgi:hypothetical protein
MTSTMDKVAPTEPTSTSRSIPLLSHLLLSDPMLAPASTEPDSTDQASTAFHLTNLALSNELLNFSTWDDEQVNRFLKVADLHHVLVRALQKLQASPVENATVANRFWDALATEQARTARALSVLDSICRELENASCSAIVIKSLDHWPDLGSDLDLYTSGPEDLVVRVMTKRFAATLLPRSWGDRLAHKWNFQIPCLNEAVEVHAGCLGQTGEHLNLARRVTTHAVRREVGGYAFRVPAIEERLIIVTLQRMYRHFYCRLCDIVDTAKLLQVHEVDFSRLRLAAEEGGIWPGVATFLVIVAEYSRAYGTQLTLPADVISSASYRENMLRLRGDFLRIPIVPQAASLFLRQVLHAACRKNVRTVSRLTLLPGLAAAAFIAYKISGDDKGIW